MTGRLILEEPVDVSSVLTPAKPASFPSLTKIIGTIGPKSHSVEALQACLTAGMSVARFDFSWPDAKYHQESLDNLKKAMKSVNKLCAVMMDTMGPELQVSNASGKSIELKAGDRVVITPDSSKAPSAEVLPIKYSDLAKTVKKGNTIFVGQYLFTGSETTSVWLEVLETKGQDVVCVVNNSAELAGQNFTMHVSQIQIKIPTLTSADKEVISTWGVQNNVDIISLSYTRSAEDVRELRSFLDSHKLRDTQIYAKIENVEGLQLFDEILQEADGIILSRGNLGIDLPPEKVFLFQKAAIHKCNLAGKPAIVTRVVDTMVGNLRPTRAEATDVANAVLDGSDGISLGAETFRGLYPVETITTVSRICAEAENVYNNYIQFKRILAHVGRPMSHEEAVAASAVRAAIKVKAAVIVVFTTYGKAPRLIAKYRPPMPAIAVVTPKPDSPVCPVSGTMPARQSLGLRAIYPIMASPDMAKDMASKEENGMKLALKYGISAGILKPHDRAVIFEKIADAFSSVVKIVECQDYLK